MEFKNTKDDFLNFYKIFYLNKIKRLSLGILPLILIVSYNIYVSQFLIWHFILAFVILSVFFFLILFALPFGISVIRFNKAISKNPHSGQKIFLQVSVDGINIDSESNNSFFKWSDISSIEKTEHLLYLITNNKKIILIPIRFFDYKNDADLLYKNIKDRVTAQNNYFDGKKAKSIYNWGYLGFIPLIGFFVGIALILRGIFQYRDKKLIYIGIGGMLFTIIIYALLIYQTEHSDSSKQRMQSLSILNMNKLVNYIELYKTQNGIYPDSLEQVKKYEEFLFIYDPIFFKRGKKASLKYYYKKIKEKYTLFSIGLDQMPNSSDDIYPEK